MILKKGDMFHDSMAHVILVTTNAFVKNNGTLVMGRGAAAQLAKLHDSIPYEFGTLIKKFQSPTRYGVIISTRVRDLRLYGAFQVKDNWFEKADLNLINNAAVKLATIADYLPNWKFALNFPGIGNGQLERSDVLPIIEYLPDNVEVWEY